MVLSLVPPSPREDPSSSPALCFYLPDFDPLTGWLLEPEFNFLPITEEPAKPDEKARQVDDHSTGSLLAADDQDVILLASGVAIGAAGEGFMEAEAEAGGDESVERLFVRPSPSRSGEKEDDNHHDGGGDLVNCNDGILLACGAAIGGPIEGFIQEEVNAGGDESEDRPAGRSSLSGSRDFINCNIGMLLAPVVAIADTGVGFMEEEEEEEEEDEVGGGESDDLPFPSVRSSPWCSSEEVEKEDDSREENVNCNGGILLASGAAIADTGVGFMEEEEEEEEAVAGGGESEDLPSVRLSPSCSGEVEKEDDSSDNGSKENVNCNGGIFLASGAAAIGDTGEGFMEEEEEEDAGGDESEDCPAYRFMEEDDDGGDESEDRPADRSSLSGSREEERDEDSHDDGCGDSINCNGGILLGDAGEGFMQEEEEEEEEARWSSTSSDEYWFMKEETEAGGDGGGEPEDRLAGCSSTSSDEYWFMKEETEAGDDDRSSPSSSGEEEDSHHDGGSGEEEKEEDIHHDGGSGEEDKEEDSHDDGGGDVNSNGGHRDCGEMDVEDEIEEGEIIDSCQEDTCASSGDDDDDDDAVVEPIISRNEIEDLPPVPQVEVCLERHHNTLPVGVISSIMGTRIIVEGLHQHSPLNGGSVLWITETRLPLGLVDEIFGSVKLPYYVIRYNNENEVPVGVSIGTAVSFVVEFANYILSGKDLYNKEYNASDNLNPFPDAMSFQQQFIPNLGATQFIPSTGSTLLEQSNFARRLFGFRSMQEQGVSGSWNAHSFLQTPSSSQGRPVRQASVALAPLEQGVSGSCNAKRCRHPPQATNQGSSGSCNVQSSGQPMATNDQGMMQPPVQFNHGRPSSSFRGRKRYRGGRYFYQRGG